MVPADSEILERSIRIEARPETVFSFFTDPKKMVLWKGALAELDPRPGGIYRVEITGDDIARGEFVELVPYSRIVFTWGWEGKDSPLLPGSSTVEITLAEDHGATLLTLRHLGLPAPLVKTHAEGWDHFLPRLAAAAEERPADADSWSM
jgi:uncharacterized protein YndB with AHSA1/START domain